MLIPHNSLSSDTLTSLIEAFIDREGTDYGANEFSRSEKISQLRSQIESGHVVIVYDEDSESCNLMLQEYYSDM